MRTLGLKFIVSLIYLHDCQELELLQDQQKTELRQQHDASLLITARHSEPTVLAQLQADLHRMYLLTDSVFNSDDHVNTSTTAHWTGSGSSSSMHVNETSDPVAGQCTEVRSSTTVRCSFREAGQAMWQGTSPQQTPATGPCNVVVSKRMKQWELLFVLSKLTLECVLCRVNQRVRNVRSQTPAFRRASTFFWTAMRSTPWGLVARRTCTSSTRTSASCSCGRPRSHSRATGQRGLLRKAGSWSLGCRLRWQTILDRCPSSGRTTRRPARHHLKTRRLWTRWCSCSNGSGGRRGTLICACKTFSQTSIRVSLNNGHEKLYVHVQRVMCESQYQDDEFQSYTVSE